MLGVDGALGLGKVTKPRGGSPRDLDSETGFVDVSKLRDKTIQGIWGMAIRERT